MIMRNIVETLYGPVYWATIHLAKSFSPIICNTSQFPLLGSV